jgi:toxin CptA
LNARSLRLELAPSTGLAALLVALHAIAALCLLVTLPGLPGMLGGTLLLGIGVHGAWRHALLRSASSVRSVDLAGAALQLRLASGASVAAEVAERRYVGRRLVMLAVRRPVRRTILVTRDMLDADSFRRLRIWALWGKLPAVATTQLPA